MRVILNNVGCIKSGTCLEFTQGINLIVGSSGSGKSTLLRALESFSSNTFQDSDVNFKSNLMKISIEDGSNTLEYIRDLHKKDKKASYIVNGEVYEKLGRTSLKEVSDILKLGDVSIGDDKVNFNFSTQFDGPFLVLGSSSLLYNILTFRSSFDVTSLNDIHSSDIKRLNSDIKLNRKLYETTQKSVSDLEDKVSALSPIESISKEYDSYKREISKVEDLKSLIELYESRSCIENSLSLLTELISLISELKNLFEIYNDICLLRSSLLEASDLNISLRNISNFISSYMELQQSYNTYVNISDLESNLCSANELQVYLSQVKDVDLCIKNADATLSLYKDLLGISSSYDDTIGIKSVIDLFKSYDNETIINLNILDDCINLQSSLLSLHSMSNSMQEVEATISSISKELGTFKVCPCCGSMLEDCLNHV